MSAKLLIVDDLAINRILLKVKLARACYDCLQAADGCVALDLARRERPRMILLDMTLPGLSGAEVCRRLRADPATADIAVVILAAHPDRATRLEALAAGADEFLTRPIDDAVLLARIRSLLRTREAETELRLRADACRELGIDAAEEPGDTPGHVAIVAASAAQAMAWRRALQPHSPDRFTLLSPAEALEDAADGAPPDLYLVGADLGAQGSGLRLVADLRARRQSRHAAIAVAIAANAAENGAMALDLGANDLLPLPLDPEETALRLRLHLGRKRRADALRRQIGDGLRLAGTDALTGLHNRRYALTHLERVAARARSDGRRYAVVMIDLDHFKAINDRHGHAAGDAVLAAVAQRLRDSLRPDDLIARIGGEEFLAVLTDASEAGARAVAERLRLAVGAVPVALPGGGAAGVTVSIGLAMGGGAPGPVLEQADAALRAAKAEGRDQVTLWPSAA